MVVQEIMNIFIKRGLRLNPPVEETSINLMKCISNNCNVKFLIDYLKLFDGFCDKEFDLESEIRLWSSSEILNYIVNNGKNIIAFSDFSFHSELFVFPIIGNNDIFDIYSGKIFANSLENFCYKLSSGNFMF